MSYESLVKLHIDLPNHWAIGGACHLFRHATVTIMLDNGVELRHVQEMLGHADVSTTQIYTHVSRAKLNAVYNKSYPSALSGQRLY